MDRYHYRATLSFLFCLLLICIATEANAQEFNDEMKRKLRESLITPDLNPSKQKIAPVQIRPQQSNPDDVLKVSPTTKLPTRFDRIEILHPLPPEAELSISLDVTNIGTSQADRSKIDYSTGKVQAVPDARSITQWVQNTRNDYGVGIHLEGDAPEWLKKIAKFINPNTKGIDIDPVRAVQRHKAKKRQEKVNNIIKAYE